MGLSWQLLVACTCFHHHATLIDLRRKKPTPVYVAAGCGAIHVRWLMYFLNRAADLRLAAALFSVHPHWDHYRMKTL